MEFKKKKIFEALFGDPELEDMEEREDEPKKESLTDVLFNSRNERIDKQVEYNKAKARQKDAIEGENIRNLKDLSRKKALEKMSNPKIEIEIQKIEVKPKKKKQDDDNADLPTPVTGSF